MTIWVGTDHFGDLRIPWDVGGPGTCGRLQPCNDVKLVDVPDMGVSASFHRAQGKC